MGISTVFEEEEKQVRATVNTVLTDSFVEGATGNDDSFDSHLSLNSE